MEGKTGTLGEKCFHAKATSVDLSGGNKRAIVKVNESIPLKR